MQNPFDGFQQGLMTGSRLGGQMRQQRQSADLGQAYATGGATGARDEALRQGNIDVASALDRQITAEERARAEERVRTLGGGVRALLSVPEAQRPQTLATLAPQLSTVFDPEALQALQSADLSDASLNAFSAALGQEAQRMQLFQTRSGDIVGVNPATGEQRLVYDGPDPERDAPQGYRWTQDGALEAIPGGPADPRVVGVRAAAGRAPARPRSGGGGSRGGARPAASPTSAPAAGRGQLPPGFTIRRR